MILKSQSKQIIATHHIALTWHRKPALCHCISFLNITSPLLSNAGHSYAIAILIQSRPVCAIAALYQTTPLLYIVVLYQTVPLPYPTKLCHCRTQPNCTLPLHNHTGHILTIPLQLAFHCFTSQCLCLTYLSIPFQLRA
jgi:hypothetical protein